MKNVLLIGLINEDLKKIGLALSNELDFFYLNTEDLLTYSIIDKIEMERVCGADYLSNEEKKIIYNLNGFEKTLISMNNETFSNNIDVIISNNFIIIYLRLTQKKFEKRVKELKISGMDGEFLNNYELTKIVFDERDKYLKKSSNLTIPYEISKLDELIKILAKIIMEQT
ncbi:MAG: hypothetical protein ACI4L1_00935 [Christensenellales bacterium]